MLFDAFDFGALDLPSYKEDAVREDIIAPILKKVGYSATGDARMERSKSLIHPFVKIGSKDYPIHIIPDYTLYWKDVALLVLEAKSPTETILKSRHVEQAFSYAIHPDVRAQFYGLCNGRQLVIYCTSLWEPVLSIPVLEIDTRWKEVEEALHPKYLLQPDLKGFQPDYGMMLIKAGFNPEVIVITFEFYWQDIMRVEDGLYTSSATCMHGDIDCLVSFDYRSNILEDILVKLPPEISESYRVALQRQPYRVELEGKVIVSCRGKLGPPTRGQHEEFVPIIVDSITGARFDPSIILEDIK